jgi:hypothetical protein
MSNSMVALPRPRGSWWGDSGQVPALCPPNDCRDIRLVTWLTPDKLQSETREYQTTISADDGALAISATLAAAPSGSGELEPVSLVLTGTVVTMVVAGGQPTRTYRLLLSVTRSDGLVSGYLYAVGVSKTLPTDTPQTPPSNLLGTPVTWSIAPATGLVKNGSTLELFSLGNYPASTSGLSPGAFWANGSSLTVSVVPGFTPVLGTPVFFGVITAAQLLALGGIGLPQSDPGVLNQLWLNGSTVCVSAG